jgi:hypothetical protein
MAGYAATARITHVAPHRVSRHDPIERDEADVVELADGTVEEISGEPFLATLSYWWEDVREIWRQGMDVVRDPRIY